MIKSKKAQGLTIDLVFAVFLFSIILLVIFASSQMLIQKIDENQVRYDLEAVSRNSIDLLLNSPGIPSNWHNNSLVVNKTNIKSLGFTDGRNFIIDEDKLNFFILDFDDNYEIYRTLMGLLGTNYSIIFNISTYDTNYNFIDRAVIGKIPENITQMIVSERVAFDTNNRFIKFRVGVWI